MDEKYCVYTHISPNGKRYIGITLNIPERRWQRGLGYKTQDYFYNAIHKYGWDNFEHEILYTNLTKEEAEQKEIELIAFYKSDNRDFGYNIDHGGNCVGKMSEVHKEKIRMSHIGRHHTEQTKNKMSISKKALMSTPENNPMYQKRHSEKAISKIRNAKTGKTLSDEHKRNISKSLIGKHNVQVSKYTMDGNFICNYKSINDAAKDVGVKKDGIIACCKNKYKTSGGYIWRYITDELTQEHINWCNSHGFDKTVIQYDKQMNFIQEFNNIKNAGIQTNTSYSGISACCNGKQKTAGGWIWKYGDNIAETVV